MKDRVVELANEALTHELELGDHASWGIGPGGQKSDAQVLDAIDRGNYEGGRIGRKMSLSATTQKLMISCTLVRYVDYRSYRWDQRLPSW